MGGKENEIKTREKERFDWDWVGQRDGSENRKAGRGVTMKNMQLRGTAVKYRDNKKGEMQQEAKQSDR